MKDLDSYQQQEGLPLTEEEKRRNSFPIRYFLIALVSYAIFVTILSFIFVPRIKENFKEGRYIARYHEYRLEKRIRSEEKKVVTLYIGDEKVEIERNMEKKGRDELHLALEALLLPLSEEEEEKDLKSYIPPKTKLLGASRKDKIVIADFSKRLLDSPDLEKAISQIEKTLRASEDNLRVLILVEGNPISE